MRIVYDHQIFSWQGYGGISRYFFEIATSLNRSFSTQVEIFAPFYLNRYLSDQSKLCKGTQVPRGGRAILRVNNMLAHLTLKLRRDIDIFHETYYSRRDLCPRSAKRVISVYDMIHEKFADQFPSGDKTRYIKYEAVRRADHVICISENTQRDLVAIYDIPIEKTSVVYLGYSLGVKQDELLLPPKVAQPYLLYVGQRAGYKNFEGLLKAYANSPVLRKEFKMVCFGGGAFSTKELEMINNLQLSPQQIIQFAGSDDVLAGLYASATAFVYPSLYEGFGIPPLEAMSFDCPVVCANTSSLPEVVGDAAEMFDPNNTEDMRTAVERVVLSKERNEELSRAGRERIKQFSWEKCAQETLALYQKLLE